MPEIRPRPLHRAGRKRFAGLLGPDPLPDACVYAIAWLIAVHIECRKLLKGQGHTPARVAAGLRRVENRMRRGHDGPRRRG